MCFNAHSTLGYLFCVSAVFSCGALQLGPTHVLHLESTARLVQNDKTPNSFSGFISDTQDPYKQLDTVVFCPAWYTDFFINPKLTEYNMSSVKAITTTTPGIPMSIVPHAENRVIPWANFQGTPACQVIPVRYATLSQLNKKTKY